MHTCTYHYTYLFYIFETFWRFFCSSRSDLWHCCGNRVERAWHSVTAWLWRSRDDYDLPAFSIQTRRTSFPSPESRHQFQSHCTILNIETICIFSNFYPRSNYDFNSATSYMRETYAQPCQDWSCAANSLERKFSNSRLIFSQSYLRLSRWKIYLYTIHASWPIIRWNAVTCAYGCTVIIRCLSFVRQFFFIFYFVCFSLIIIIIMFWPSNDYNEKQVQIPTHFHWQQLIRWASFCWNGPTTVFFRIAAVKDNLFVAIVIGMEVFWCESSQ